VDRFFIWFKVVLSRFYVHLGFISICIGDLFGWSTM